MRGREEVYGLVVLLVFVFVIIGIHEANAQEQVIAVEWGGPMDCPDLGFNARITRQHAEENCAQPIQEDFRYDWNSADLRQDVRNLGPKILRFPGGTPSNFWNWYSETRQVIGDDGTLQSLDICEASLIGRSNSSAIGCSGNNLDMTAQWYDSIAINTTVTLESYLTAVDHFRNQGMDVQELFVLNMLDPFYYLGSPHLEYITQGAGPEAIRDTLKNNIVQRVEKQLDKILLEKCGNCDDVDDLVHFELGNEFHLQRYGKYYPRLDCFDMPEDSLCVGCFTDISFYADVCEAIVPMIRERFSHAKISMCASRDILHEDWNQVILDRFGQGDDLQIDAAVYHFYPKTFHKDSLTYGRCVGNGNNYNADKSLHYVQAHMDRLMDQKNLIAFNDSDIEIWITEFNSYDYSEQCDANFGGWQDEDFVYDSADWLHTLNVFTIMDRFLTYRSAMEDPWTGNALDMDISKIAMHLFYGAEREAAMNEERELTAAGMAIQEVIHLMNDADSIQRVLIAPQSQVAVDTEGNWTTSIPEGEMLPLYHELEYMDHTGSLDTMKTLDAHGWIFKSDEGNKALIVNLRNEAIELNVDGMGSFQGNTAYEIHSVEASDLTMHIDHGWNTDFIVSESGMTGAASLELPAYSFAILEDVPVQLPSSLSESHLDLFHIYPNPTSGVVNIKMADEVREERITVDIKDLRGSVLMSEQVYVNNTVQLDLSVYASGMYLVDIQGEDWRETVRLSLSH